MSMNTCTRTLLLAATAIVLPAVGLAQRAVTTTASTVSKNVPQFLWFDSQNALRLGQISNAQPYGFPSPWTQVGAYSVAFGYDNMAVGSHSLVHGASSTAMGSYSFVFGNVAFSAGSYSLVFGDHASAPFSNSVAIGNYASAVATDSIVIGRQSSAQKTNSVQIGNGGSSQGVGAINLGDGHALGNYAFGGPYSYTLGTGSIALGYQTSADGDYSTAVGSGAHAIAWGHVALGLGNVAKRQDGSAISYATPSNLDPVLEVALPKLGSNVTPGTKGNQNALTIYRNGQAHLVGALRVPPSGDIPMKANPQGINPSTIY